MKQIRVQVDDKTYQELKSAAKKYRLTLAQIGGLKINGFEIVERKKQ